MVYCPKCGANNEVEAKFCVKCGASLFPERGRERRRDGCFGERRQREEECFGIPHGGTVAGIILGIFIIIIGLGIATGRDIGGWIGPSVIIVFGLLMVVGAIFTLSRR